MHIPHEHTEHQSRGSPLSIYLVGNTPKVIIAREFNYSHLKLRATVRDNVKKTELQGSTYNHGFI